MPRIIDAYAWPGVRGGGDPARVLLRGRRRLRLLPLRLRLALPFGLRLLLPLGLRRRWLRCCHCGGGGSSAPSPSGEPDDHCGFSSFGRCHCGFGFSSPGRLM